MEDGTRAVQEIINWKELKKSWKPQKFSESDTIPFAMIDEIPLYPGLEKSKSTKEDFSQQIAVFIKENFDTDMANHLGLESGKKRIYVQFTIDRSGNITKVRARAPHKRLEEEAVRVISSLPQMKPGIKDGKEVAVKYTLPITLNVE
jgi:protein TonB